VAIVVTLFVSPTATDRVFYASGVLLVAAFAVGADQMFAERLVRRFVVGACVLVFGYHVVRFVDTSIAIASESADRLAILEAARPGSVAIVPTFDHAQRSRWHLGDDFAIYPWLRDYVGGELFDLAGVDLDRPDRARRVVRIVADQPVPTYRQLQAASRRAPCAPVTIRAEGLYDDPRGRPVIVLDRTAAGDAFVDGRPEDTSAGHVIRVRRASIPSHLESTRIIGCAQHHEVLPQVDDDGGDALLPVDERFCRGPFTAIMCDPDRCWVAGWY